MEHFSDFLGVSISHSKAPSLCIDSGTSVQFSSVAQSTQHFATPWTAARQASLSIASTQSLLKLMYIELVMPSNHFILCYPLLFPPSALPRVSSSHKVVKYYSFSFNISPSNEYSLEYLGLISFRMDWLDLLEVQGTLESLLHHHSSKASIIQHSAGKLLKEEKENTEELQNNQKASNNIVLSTYLSIITLNDNGINAPIKR